MISMVSSAYMSPVRSVISELQQKRADIRGVSPGVALGYLQESRSALYNFRGLPEHRAIPDPKVTELCNALDRAKRKIEGVEAKSSAHIAAIRQLEQQVNLHYFRTVRQNITEMADTSLPNKGGPLENIKQLLESQTNGDLFGYAQALSTAVKERASALDFMAKDPQSGNLAKLAEDLFQVAASGNHQATLEASGRLLDALSISCGNLASISNSRRVFASEAIDSVARAIMPLAPGMGF